MITGIVGNVGDPELAEKLHRLEHRNEVEILTLSSTDMQRRRFRGRTNKGTEIAIALDGKQRLANGSVLLLEETRAVVVRSSRQQWLRITPRDMDAALEAGYHAGNHHWRVRFEPGVLLVAVEGSSETYVSALANLTGTDRIELADDE